MIGNLPAFVQHYHEAFFLARSIFSLLIRKYFWKNHRKNSVSIFFSSRRGGTSQDRDSARWVPLHWRRRSAEALLSEGRKLSASSRLSDGVGSGRSREGRCTFGGRLSLGVEGCHAKRAQLALNVPKNVQIVHYCSFASRAVALSNHITELRRHYD